MIQKHGKVCFVIAYECNVSVNSSWVSMNPNSTLLDLSSSQTTQTGGTSHMIHKSTITPDATSGG